MFTGSHVHLSDMFPNNIPNGQRDVANECKIKNKKITKRASKANAEPFYSISNTRASAYNFCIVAFVLRKRLNISLCSLTNALAAGQVSSCSSTFTRM